MNDWTNVGICTNTATENGLKCGYKWGTGFVFLRENNAPPKRRLRIEIRSGERNGYEKGMDSTSGHPKTFVFGRQGIFFPVVE